MKIPLFILLILVSFEGNTQEFAPIGAKWIFPERYAFNPNVGIVTYESIGDTIIENLNFRKIHRDMHSCHIRFKGNFFIHERNDSIFIKNPRSGELELIIDFNANIGDSWTLGKYSEYSYSDSIRCKIDSISELTINDQVFKIQHATLSYYYFYDFSINTEKVRIIEDIGFDRALIPINDSVVCDGNFEQEIRCYEDPIIGTINFSNEDCYSTPVKDITIDNSNFRVYPNPTSNILQIDLPLINMKFELSIHNIYGGLMGQYRNEDQIDLTHYPKGNYIISYRDESIFVSQRFIKI